MLQYYNFYMFNRIKYLTALLIACTSIQAWSAGKSDKYDQLMKLGTTAEITKAFKNDSSMARTKLGDEKDSLLMRAIKYDRDISIITLLYRGGISDNHKNKNGQDVLSYACQYSTNKAVIKKILAKTCPAKKARKILSKQDKTGKSPLDYAKENPDGTAYSLVSVYFLVEPEVIEENPIINITADDEEITLDSEEIISEENKEDPLTENELAEEESVKNSETNAVVSAEPEVETKKEEEKELQKTEVPAPIQQEVIKKEEEAVEEKTQEKQSEIESEIETKIEVTEIFTPEHKQPEEIIPASTAIETKKYDKVFLYDFAVQEEDPIPEEDDTTLELAVIEFPNRQDKNGKTALMTAAKEGNDWEIRSLLKSKADVNLRDKDGWTALMYAVRYQNNLDLVNCLLQAGANPDVKNKFGSSALQIAAGYTSNPDILKKLTSISKASSDDMFKAFVMAITSNTTNSLTQVSKLNVFLSYGVPINRFYEGRTPLMYAAEYSASTEVIKLLLDNGAAKNLRTPDGKTVFNFAESNKLLDHNEIYWSLNQQ